MFYMYTKQPDDALSWMQRKTKNQIGILCAGVGSNLCEDGDGEGVGDLHVL